MICSDIWHKYHEWYFEIVIRNFTSRQASEIWDNFEISRVVFLPNITYKSCYYFVNMIGPRSTFAISSTVVRFPIFVKSLWSWRTGCTPSAILNTKHTVTCSYCSYRTLGNSIFSNVVLSVQNRIHPLQGWNCSIFGISVASNAIISWKMEFALVLVNNQKIRKECATEFMTLADYVIPRN